MSTDEIAQPGRAALPSWVNDLDGSLAECWRLLARGVVDRRSPMHHPTIGTTGPDGAPRLRTVILRGVDTAQRELRFHTDQRSPKVVELRGCPRIALHAYDPGGKIQIRVEGTASLHTDDAVADLAWQKSRAMSRVVYSAQPAPGTAIAEPGAFTLAAEDASEEGRAHFTLVRIAVANLEWLYLAHSGHRRARFEFSPDRGVMAQWLAP